MKVLLVFYLCSTSLRSKVPSLLFGMQYEYVMTNLRLTILCSVLSSFIFLSIATCPEFTLLLCVSTTPSKKLKLSQGSDDLEKYLVILDLMLVNKYKGSNKPLQPLYSDVMRQAGSSESHITSDLTYIFFAWLTKEQAIKLICDDRVFEVSPEGVYVPPKSCNGIA
ncbi:unnamed protein product [Cuscuta campestris]|uniref:Uncharacterized protein n=1 Tax=Cuscuta campestris TaxID=132261 RepID=A0A484KQK9_9ASTE|nr:unnamed protein product [Cuscuta campestris]